MTPGYVLVVDNDTPMRRVLHAVLPTFGIETTGAARGDEALSLIRKTRFDAILLDIEVPGVSGIDTCRKMHRLIPRTPILILTVRDGEDDKVEALEAGADDYITKPFHLRELVARIRAAMRWANMSEPPEPAVRIGEIELDPMDHTAKKADRMVRLTPKEFKLTHRLMTSVGRPVPHSKLLNSVWGPGHEDELDYLRTFVYQVRKKLEDDPSNPRYLLTEPNFGYRFVDGS